MCALVLVSGYLVLQSVTRSSCVLDSWCYNMGLVMLWNFSAEVETNMLIGNIRSLSAHNLKRKRVVMFA